jgi:hypothetical protein
LFLEYNTLLKQNGDRFGWVIVSRQLHFHIYYLFVDPMSYEEGKHALYLAYIFSRDTYRRWRLWRWRQAGSLCRAPAAEPCAARAAPYAAVPGLGHACNTPSRCP